MPEFSDEILMAYVDGELADFERVRVEAALRTDPALERRLRAFRMTRDHLKVAFNDVLYAPIPQHLVQNVLRAPIARRNAAKRTGFGERLMSAFDFQGFSENFSFARMATASAVVLAAVLGANWMLKPSSSTNGDKAAFDLATLSVPGSAAPALLAHGLETVASGQDWIAPKKRFALRPTLTVASKDGSFCRRFEVATRDGTQAAGFACRSGEKSWTVEALGSVRLATAPKSSDSVAPAGASDPLIDSAISRLAIGDVLSTEHEAEVLAHGWKKIVEGE